MMTKGSEHNIFYTLSGGLLFKPKVQINGYVKKGYESVKKEFENNFAIGIE